MFFPSLQTSTLSLFSSTNSVPLQLFTKHTDPSLPEDSCIHLLHDASSHPAPPPPAHLIPPLKTDYALDQTVLHIQSPTIHTTFIQSPPELGIVLPWMHVQVRNLHKEWALEVGLVDQSARMGILRLSTFQVRVMSFLPPSFLTPKLQKSPRLSISPTAPPLLHIPLSFPAPSTRPLTPWSTLALHLPSYIPYFSSAKLLRDGGGVRSGDGVCSGDRGGDGDGGEGGGGGVSALPGGTYAHVAYVRVYATCRLRRIWFTQAGGPRQRVPWEFELYGCE
ncbi:hypothetical protein C0992_005177 [Termitomyces sp. T32_za158]|nr:hypothetical protein C0992_005177 [Termitomyces sp. T32_za158]